MSTSTLVPVEQYLAQSFRPDREYIDGVIQERNVGEREHSEIQGELIVSLNAFRERLNLRVFPEQRVQVKPHRFRVPDIVVTIGKVTESVLTRPPFLCIEVLSREDSMDSVQDRVDDYLSFGVPFVWVVNPRTRRGWIYQPGRIAEAAGGILSTTGPDIAVSLPDLYARIDA
jgi:Uma2 family endonuclease